MARRSRRTKILATWDLYNVPIITEMGGTIEFRDMIPGITIKKEVDQDSGVAGMVVIEHKEDLHPQVVVQDQEDEGSPRELLHSCWRSLECERQRESVAWHAGRQDASKGL